MANAQFAWSEQQSKAFDKVKNLLWQHVNSQVLWQHEVTTRSWSRSWCETHTEQRGKFRLWCFVGGEYCKIVLFIKANYVIIRNQLRLSQIRPLQSIFNKSLLREPCRLYRMMDRLKRSSLQARTTYMFVRITRAFRPDDEDKDWERNSKYQSTLDNIAGKVETN